MDTVQILWILRDVRSFIDVFLSDLLPYSIARNFTLTINSHPHTQRSSHWLAVNVTPKSSGTYYFDSYDIEPIFPDFQAFIKSNCATLKHTRGHLQGLTIKVCGKYCHLFALYMVRGYTPKQLISLSDACNADLHVEWMFATGFRFKICGALGPYDAAAYKCRYFLTILIIPNLTWLEVGRSWSITGSCGATEWDGGQGTLLGQRRRVRDIPFQEHLHICGS